MKTKDLIELLMAADPDLPVVGIDGLPLDHAQIHGGELVIY